MLGDLRVHGSRILVIGTAVVLMLALTYFVQRTRLGRAMRAVSTDLDAAQMMGVDVNRVVMATFFIGAVLAGAAGVLVGVVFFSIRHTMGFAAVLGGIGSIPGAVLGGLIIGMAEAFTSVYISATYKDAVAFIILVLILIIRPSGLMGKPLVQKV
jgi:branched-chain amino acid transport system permease protein